MIFLRSATLSSLPLVRNKKLTSFSLQTAGGQNNILAADRRSDLVDGNPGSRQPFSFQFYGNATVPSTPDLNISETVNLL